MNASDGPSSDFHLILPSFASSALAVRTTANASIPPLGEFAALTIMPAGCSPSPALNSRRPAATGEMVTRLDIDQIHAALYFSAEILRAGDDLLPGIASFVKANSSYGLEVHHLWNELFLRGGCDDWNARLDVQPAPARRSYLHGVTAQATP